MKILYAPALSGANAAIQPEDPCPPNYCSCNGGNSACIAEICVVDQCGIDQCGVNDPCLELGCNGRGCNALSCAANTTPVGVVGI